MNIWKKELLMKASTLFKRAIGVIILAVSVSGAVPVLASTDYRAIHDQYLPWYSAGFEYLDKLPAPVFLDQGRDVSVTECNSLYKEWSGRDDSPWSLLQLDRGPFCIDQSNINRVRIVDAVGVNGRGYRYDQILIVEKTRLQNIHYLNTTEKKVVELVSIAKFFASTSYGIRLVAPDRSIYAKSVDPVQFMHWLNVKNADSSVEASRDGNPDRKTRTALWLTSPRQVIELRLRSDEGKETCFAGKTLFDKAPVEIYPDEKAFKKCD
jgi:hypothetical protein